MTMDSLIALERASDEGESGYTERLRRLAVELVLDEERQRREIAEDLHDHLGQGLALLRVKLMELKGNAIFCGLDRTIEDMDRLLNQAIRYTRSLTLEISPPMLYELGLSAAIEWLAEEYAKRHHLTIQVVWPETSPHFPITLGVMLFKSVRELLMNVVKHAQARQVRLEARQESEAFVLEISDDGVGFASTRAVSDAGVAADHGFGLFSIRERLRLFGGSLHLDTPERGARVTIRLPLGLALAEMSP